MRKHLFKFSDLYHAAGWLLTKASCSVLPIAILNRIATLKGRFNFSASEQRDTLKKNLMATLGDSHNENELEAIVRRHFEFISKFEMLLQTLSVKGFSKAERWPVEGMQHLEEALGRGKGVILASAHFGYARFIKYILESGGHTVRVVGSQSEKSSKSERRNKEQFDRLTTFGRAMQKRFQIELFDFGFKDLCADFNVRPLLEVLQANGILLIMGDGTRSSNLVPLNFLGHTSPFPAGMTRIALLTGATILPTFAVDTPQGNGVKIIIEKPLGLEKNKASAPEVIAKNVSAFVQVLEAYVKRYPHLYKVIFKENRFERKMARSKRDAAERYVPSGKQAETNVVEAAPAFFEPRINAHER